MEVPLLEIVLGFGIGLTLGLLGGGGSILTVPALVYLVGQTPQTAVTTSLAIVGANSIFGAAFHNHGGTLNWKVAAIFGSVGMATSFLAAGLSKAIPPALIMVLFGLLMIVVGMIMLLRREQAVRLANAGASAAVGNELVDLPQTSLISTLAAGAGVGLLTGILGVGGGFLIVPALVMLVGLPMYQAVGTSLAIIAANSLAGLLGHLGTDPFDYGLLAVFVLAGIGGTYLGMRLARILPAKRLRQAFAIFVIILAIFLLLDNFPKSGMFG